MGDDAFRRRTKDLLQAIQDTTGCILQITQNVLDVRTHLVKIAGDQVTGYKSGTADGAFETLKIAAACFLDTAPDAT